MINIRKGCFETNSSSTHAICLQKSDKLNIPERLFFCLGEFGWDEGVLSSPYELASYLYTAILCNYEDKKEIASWKNWISDVLKKHGCDCKFEDPDGYYYIDHSYELEEWLKQIRRSEKKLLRLLFGVDTIIITGNDNSSWFGEQMDNLDDYSPNFKKTHSIYRK